LASNDTIGSAFQAMLKAGFSQTHGMFVLMASLTTEHAKVKVTFPTASCCKSRMLRLGTPKRKTCVRKGRYLALDQVAHGKPIQNAGNLTQTNPSHNVMPHNSPCYVMPKPSPNIDIHSAAPCSFFHDAARAQHQQRYRETPYH